MQGLSAKLNQDPSTTNDTSDDLLEKDLAESLALNNRSRCARLAGYIGLFFKSKPASDSASGELNKVIVVNPTFVPRGPAGSSSQ